MSNLLKAEDIKHESITQMQLMLPISCAMLLRRTVDVVSLVFVGHIKGDQLYIGGVGLATTIANVTGYSMLVGLTGALSTFASVAKGANDDEMLVLSLQRMILMALLICIPITLLWSNSYDIIITLGQEENIANLASQYLFTLIPGLWFLGLSACLQTWLYAQNDTKMVMIMAILQTCIHPFINYWFIYTMEMGWLGAGAASSVSKGIYFALIVSYIDVKYSSKLNLRIRKESFNLLGWLPMLKLAVPNLMMMMEWWASEVIIFMSGLLPTDANVNVASMTIFQQTNSICFMLPAGIQMAGSARVGNSIGAGNAKAAHLSAYTAPLVGLALSSTMAVVLLCIRDHWGKLFTSNEEVIRLVAILLQPLSVYIIADGVQCSLTAVIKGTGKQAAGGPVVIFSYYIIGLPVAIFLAFNFGLSFGVIGLCIGTAIGTWVHMLIYLYICNRIDWEEEVLIAAQRQNHHGNQALSKNISESNSHKTTRMELGIRSNSSTANGDNKKDANYVILDGEDYE